MPQNEHVTGCHARDRLSFCSTKVGKDLRVYEDRSRANRYRRRSVLALAVLLGVLIVGGAAGLIAFAWRAVDAEVAGRETQLVRRAVTRTDARLGRETTSAAEWDDAFDRTARRDLRWIDLYLAGYYRSSFDHDVTLVFDPTGALFYGARAGARVRVGELSELARAAAPLVHAVQAEELRRRARLDYARPLDVSSLSWRTAAVEAGGQVYLLTAASLLPSSRLLRGQQPVQVVLSGRAVDARFLQEFEQDLGLSAARLKRGAFTGRVGEAPLLDDRGAPVAAIAWDPARPGIQVVKRRLEPIAAALLAMAAVCALLWVRIRGLLLGIAAKDRELEDSLADLVAARDAAQAASVAKSQFIANVSHEIRPPLNGVLGMAQAMESDELSPRQRARLGIVRESGESLLAILNDVLDLAKIEAGRLELEMTEFDLGDLAKGAHAAFTALADRKGLDFTLTVSDEARGRYRSDSTRVRQILYNLISNALKFTEQGSVRVEVARARDGLRFDVADTGVGMTDEVRRKVFDSFQQADASTTRRFGGTGLGLAICRELTQRLGGRIDVTSTPGRGSVFTVLIPATRLGDAAPPRPAPPAPEGLPAPSAAPGGVRVLAAEDNPINQLVLKTLLHQVGLDPTVVGDGAQALDAWRSADWDVILMDVQMPILDGPDATRQIRLEEARLGRPRVPIVALTANAMSHQVNAYLAAGMDACVSKPIDLAQLLDVISDVLGDPAHRPDAETASA